jgi:transposase
MDTRGLHQMWNAPENTRLTKQQFSFRLPLDVAAKLFALEELYPGRNRTQIISDLLSLALIDFEEQLPFRASQFKFTENGDDEDLWSMEGERYIFRTHANKHHRMLYRDGKGYRNGTLYQEVAWRQDEIPPEASPQ